jgi:zinc protease
MKSRRPQSQTNVIATAFVYSGITLALASALVSCASTPSATKTETSVPSPVGAGPSHLPAVTPTPSPVQSKSLTGSFKVERLVLKNGMRVLAVQDKSSPTFAYQTWFDVGSRNEVPQYTGLAHLFEHMMFKATQHYADGEFFKRSEMAGAEDSNAFTTTDYTAYIQEFPKERLDLIMSMESDRMVNLIIDEKAFKTEREVVQNERRMRYENNPDGLLRQELYRVGFQKQPYRWPVIGYAEDLDRMSAQDAVQFYKKYYNPKLATLVIVGDFEFDQLKSLLDKYYAPLSSAEVEPTKIEIDEPILQPIRSTITINTQVEKLMLAYRIPAVNHEDVPSLMVLASLLSGGKSSRLDRALVNTGIANGVGAYASESRDQSLFVVAVNLQAKKSATQAESVVLREIEQLMTETINEREVQKAKNLLLFGQYAGLSSNAGLAQYLGESETIYGNYEKGFQLLDRLQNIQATDLQNVLKKYFQPQSRIVATAVSKPSEVK